MAVLLNSFAGGTDTTAITTGNSGGSSGNAFDAVNTSGAGTTLTFSATQAAHGSLSGHIHLAAVSSKAYLSWTGAMGPRPQIWFRAYLWHAANPSPSIRLWQADIGGATLCGQVLLLSSGLLQFADTNSGNVHTFTATVPLSAWYRIEGWLTGNASTGQVSLSLYKTPDSVTADETFTSPASWNTAGTPDSYRFGQFSTVTESPAFDLYYDDVGLSSAGPLGPFSYLFTGPQSLDYLDYIDLATGQTLVVQPGGSYVMQAVNSRAGLTVPPPDGRWDPPAG